jgi:adenine phosphoribosyltransferase
MTPTPAHAPGARRDAGRSAFLKRFSWLGEHADVWPVFGDPEALSAIVAGLAEPLEALRPTHIAAVEARGFLLGGAVAIALGAGFVPIRKRDGMLPGPVAAYRTDPDYMGRSHVLRLSRTALGPHDRVALIDDWLETGAQLRGAAALIREAGADLVGTSVIVDQAGPTAGLANLHSLVTYDELPTPTCCTT